MSALSSREVDLLIEAIEAATTEPLTRSTGCCMHSDAEIAFQFRGIKHSEAREILFKLRGMALEAPVLP